MQFWYNSSNYKVSAIYGNFGAVTAYAPYDFAFVCTGTTGTHSAENYADAANRKINGTYCTDNYTPDGYDWWSGINWSCGSYTASGTAIDDECGWHYNNGHDSS